MGTYNLLTRPRSQIGSTAGVQTGPELTKDRCRKSFGEDVGVLRCGRHMKNMNITKSNLLPNEVQVDLYVLGALMLNRVGRHVDALMFSQ